MSSYCKCPVALPHGPWVGLFVDVVFPDHTHLLSVPTERVWASELDTLYYRAQNLYLYFLLSKGTNGVLGKVRDYCLKTIVVHT